MDWWSWLWTKKSSNKVTMEKSLAVSDSTAEPLSSDGSKKGEVNKDSYEMAKYAQYFSRLTFEELVPVVEYHVKRFEDEANAFKDVAKIYEAQVKVYKDQGMKFEDHLKEFKDTVKKDEDQVKAYKAELKTVKAHLKTYMDRKRLSG